MTQDEMLEKYHELYDYMAMSGEKKNMQTFGDVLTEMYEWFVANKQDMAKDLLDELCAVKWHNYLSKKEADDIVSSMMPKPIWAYDIVMKALTDLGYKTEEDPFYNTYALWVVVSMVYSDSADSIAYIMGKTKDTVDNTDLLKACYRLAIDKLKDGDNVFNVKRYFSDED